MSHGCQVSPPSLSAGPRVLRVSTVGTAAAFGVLLGQHADSELAAYLASGPTAPPPWFPLVALVQSPDRPSAVFSALAPGEVTVVCVGGLADRPRFAGKTSLLVTGE